MQYLPPFGESHLIQCMGPQQPSYNSNPAFQVSSGAVSAGSAQDYIVGQGEVVAVANPDGTGSFFFIPTAVRWSPDLCNGSGCFRNFCPNKNFTSGVWLVTSISNPVPVHVFSQVIQKRGCMVPPPVRSFVSDVNLSNMHTSSCVGPQFHAQFHNDGCTSTTDLHYFFPSLRCREWVPHLGACVQVDLPPREGNTYHYGWANKLNGRNSVSTRSYDNNSIVETNSMCVDEDVSTLPETKDQYVFTVTETCMQTNTAISQPTQMLCNLDASVAMPTCNFKTEAKTQICEYMTPISPIRINSPSEQTPPCSCGSLGSIEKILAKTNRILQFQEIPSQTDPQRQTQHTETFCTCSREPCVCNIDKCDVNDKLSATFENTNMQTDPKTNVNSTQMCCCFNSNCGTCECIFNDAKKHKLTTTFEECNAQTDAIQRPLTENAFSSCKPECCDQCTDRSQTSFLSQESDCQTTSKDIRSTATGTYACVCECCNCGEDTEESGEDEPYCQCHTGYCCCPNNSSTTQSLQRRETEIRCSNYR